MGGTAVSEFKALKGWGVPGMVEGTAVNGSGFYAYAQALSIETTGIISTFKAFCSSNTFNT